MTFDEKNNYSDQESAYRVDLMALARLELADAAFFVDESRSTNDARRVRLSLEGSVNKTASAWQLFVRGCKYVERVGSDAGVSAAALAERAKDLRETANSAHPKGGSSAVGRIANWRADLFHEGIHFLDQITSYPCAQIRGRGFVGVRVFKDAQWTVDGYRTFVGTSDAEWALTSDGIYRISNPRTSNERWARVEDTSTTTFIADDDVFKLLDQAQAEMADLLNKLESLMGDGIDGIPLTFLNEGGNAQVADGHSTYDLGASRRLEVRGELTSRSRTK